MNGHVLEELPIAVDCFNNANAQLYFLTHAHSDHTVGLTKSWKKSKIYCTELTAKLTVHRLGVRYSWFDILEIHQEYIFKLHLNGGWIILTVTVLPANHCPGSCMFVFETSDIKVLYTGDFKPNAKMFETGQSVWGPTSRTIDVMYVDNTYADRRCVLPSQETMVDEIIQLCKAHEDCTIFIGTYWTGHEDLLKSIASKTRQPIVVEQNQMAVLELMGDTNSFTVDKFGSDLHALPMHRVTKHFMREINVTEKSIAIIPTGRLCHQFHTVTKDEHIYRVPFSHHPSYSELQNFISVSKPVIVKPVVKGKSQCRGMGSLQRADMTQFCHNLTVGSSHFPPKRCMPARSQECVSRCVGVTADNQRKTARRPKRSRSCKPLGVIFED